MQQNIPYTIDLATTQKTYILNLNNIFLSPSLLIHTTLQYNCMQKNSSKNLWASKVHVPSFFPPK